MVALAVKGNSAGLSSRGRYISELDIPIPFNNDFSGKRLSAEEHECSFHNTVDTVNTQAHGINVSNKLGTGCRDSLLPTVACAAGIRVKKILRWCFSHLMHACAKTGNCDLAEQLLMQICGPCNLRGSCERAYAMAREDGGGRTVDVMRILLTYELDVMTGSVESQLCLNKNVEESSRKFLCEILRFSCKELDSNCQEVTSRSLSPGSQQESEKQMPKGLSNTSTRKGDWICSKISDAFAAMKCPKKS